VVKLNIVLTVFIIIFIPIPGLIAEVKRKRGYKLRQTVLARKTAATKMQAVW
jgi:hypothetical protein